jgi:hypothetical protein
MPSDGLELERLGRNGFEVHRLFFLEQFVDQLLLVSQGLGI